MRVLWMCNVIPPVLAEELGLPVSNKEGWISGILDSVMADRENGIELGVCFPVPDKKQREISGTVKGISYYGFFEDLKHPYDYDKVLAERVEGIVADFRPQIGHIFGTEFYHAINMAYVFRDAGRLNRLLVSLQGICSKCAECYTLGIPEEICRKKTFRDWLKKDNILQQQEAFWLRGRFEEALIGMAGNIAGRTAWDKAYVMECNGETNYYKWNETLRSNFYGKEWNLEDCERHSIFVSQGNYPIKGVHLALRAMPKVLKAYPDAKMYVAGDRITAYETWKDKVKIGTYGKFLLDLVRENHLDGKVVFLGKLDAERMCGQFLKSHVFLSASLVENSPNSVGEAMLLGVPVVSSEVGGVTSLLEGEKEGLLYRIEDTDKMAEQIIRIFSDDGLALELSAAGKRRAGKTHDPRTNYERLLEIYHEINLRV